VQDFRRVLDDKAVDAVVVATPDHWHALATVWGCQAGKHVYVEKPASQTPWEGRKMVEAARKYRRVVQLGTQSRSAPYMIQAKEYIESGKLGRIHLCRVYDQKQWGNVKAVADSTPPAHLDWNMWNGPAPEANYNFNYWENWNHFWRYSGGDIINDSIHQMDLARWLTAKDYPKSVYSVGGRWAESGVYETPDTQSAVYEFDDMVMTFEMTLWTPYMILADQALRDGDMFPYWPQNASRIEIYGTRGLMIVGRHGGGWQVFGRPKGRKPEVVAQQFGRWSDKEHRDDFCNAIRHAKLPHADIEEGHRSTLLCQWANISYRRGGEKLVVDAKTESFTNSRPANTMLRREYRTPWVVPETV
jgi:predicted dehydrogenase